MNNDQLLSHADIDEIMLERTESGKAPALRMAVKKLSRIALYDAIPHALGFASYDEMEQGLKGSFLDNGLSPAPRLPQGDK